jgi:type I restriction enzyme S subunit
MTKHSLPENWIKSPIGDLCTLVNGRAFKPTEWTASGLPIIRIQNLNNPKASFNRYDGDYNQRVLIEPGELLFAWSGTPGTSFGAHVWRGETAILNQHIFRVLFERASIDPDFFRHAINQRLMDLIADAQGGVGLRHVTKGKFERTKISLPPRTEQTRIVHKIEALQQRTRRARTALDAIPPLIEKFRQSVLASAFRGDLTADWRAQNPDVEPASVLLERIREERRRRWEEAEMEKMRAKGKVPSGEGWKGKYKEPPEPDPRFFPELPQGWCWATIEQLASDEPRSIQSGPFGSNLRHSEFTALGKLVIGIDNVQAGFFSSGRQNRISNDKFEELQKYQARPLDFLITVMATVGRCCVVPPDLEDAIITKHVYRVTLEKDLFIPQLLVYAFLGATSVADQISSRMRGQTRLGINGKILKKVAVPIPPYSEQVVLLRRIGLMLQRLDAPGNKLPLLRRKIDELDQSILAKAFRGELVPQDPTDEPASVLLDRIRAEKSAEAPRRRGGSPAVPRSREALSSVIPSNGERIATTGEGAVFAALEASESVAERRPRDFTADDWHHALLESIGDDTARREDVIEAASIWAAENMGLVFQRLRRDGLVVKGLKNALRTAVRRKEVERVGALEVRRTP